MCLQSKALVSSHLIPQAMYDYCRKGEHRPIKVGDGVLFATDRQTQVVLLCKECEDVLNRGGEMWIAKKLATPEGTFPLYSILTTHPPDFDEGDYRFYFGARNADVETDKLTHLALGIFWKASVHSWRSRETEPCIDLGPYSDRIRFWLRGENEFPKNVYLLAEVFPPDRAQIALSGPYEGVRLGWRRFLLHLPGLSFTLNVGKTVDHTIRSLCIQTNPGHPIVVSIDTTKLTQQLSRTLHQSRKTESFLCAMEKVRREHSERSNKCQSISRLRATQRMLSCCGAIGSSRQGRETINGQPTVFYRLRLFPALCLSGPWGF